MPMLLRANVADEMRGAVAVAVGMAVEARDAAMRALRAAVAGHVELLLRKGREQQPQAVELLGIEDAVEELHEIVDRDALAFRHVAEVGPRGQKDGRGKLREEMIGQIEVEIEAGQVALLLLLQLVDFKLGEKHAALGMVGVRQRKEAGRPRHPFRESAPASSPPS